MNNNKPTYEELEKENRKLKNELEELRKEIYPSYVGKYFKRNGVSYTEYCKVLSIYTGPGTWKYTCMFITEHFNPLVDSVEDESINIIINVDKDCSDLLKEFTEVPNSEFKKIKNSLQDKVTMIIQSL